MKMSRGLAIFILCCGLMSTACSIVVIVVELSR